MNKVVSFALSAIVACIASGIFLSTASAEWVRESTTLGASTAYASAPSPGTSLTSAEVEVTASGEMRAETHILGEYTFQMGGTEEVQATGYFTVKYVWHGETPPPTSTFYVPVSEVVTGLIDNDWDQRADRMGVYTEYAETSAMGTSGSIQSYGLVWSKNTTTYDMIVNADASDPLTAYVIVPVNSYNKVNISHYNPYATVHIDLNASVILGDPHL